MEKRKIKDVQLLLGLVVIMSVFNLLSMQFYVSGFGEGSVKKVVGNEIENSVPQANAPATKIAINQNKETKKNSALDSIKNLFVQKTTDNSDSSDSSLDILTDNPAQSQSNSNTQTGNTQDQNTNAQNNEQTNTQTGNNEQNSGNTNNDNTQTTDSNNGNQNDNSNSNDDSSDSQNPLDDYVPPNDTGPPAESVEGKTLEFHFGSGLGGAGS